MRKSVREIQPNNESVKLQMSSMIDIVFLLLSFFVITYRTPEIEGDFNIKMPVQSQAIQLPSLDELTPVIVKLAADDAGNLTGIWFATKPLGTKMDKLREAVFQYVQADGGIDYASALWSGEVPNIRTDFELELDCDHKLRYKYVMQAISAVTGYINGDNQIVKLVEKVKFTPPPAATAP